MNNNNKEKNENKELKAKQRICLDILHVFNDFCVNNNVTYYLAYGSLLGAIRNNGLIPWDDDIDIWMPRHDYNKIIEIANKQLINGIRLEHHSLCKTKNCAKTHHVQIVDSKYTLTKEWSIEKDTIHPWIDVFPLDGMPKNTLLFLIHYFKYTIWWLIMQLSWFNKNINVVRERNILSKLCINVIKRINVFSKVNTLIILKKIDSIASKYEFNNSETVASLYGAYKNKEFLKKSWFNSASYVKFEDLELPIPYCYDQILKNYYGEDYLIPKVEHSKHYSSFASNV